jgi:hypothetical protein
MLKQLKEYKLTIGGTTLVGAAIYGIAEYGSGGDSGRVMVAAAIGGAMGAFIGSAFAIGIGYAHNVGARPYTPIFGSVGAAIPLVLELPSLVKGRRTTVNKELIRNVAVGGSLGSTLGLAIDYYQGQM